MVPTVTEFSGPQGLVHERGRHHMRVGVLRDSKAKARGEMSQEGSAETRGSCLVSRLENKGLHWSPWPRWEGPGGRPFLLPWEQLSLAQGGPIGHCHAAPAGTPGSSPPLGASGPYLGCLSPLTQPGMCSVILSSRPDPSPVQNWIKNKNMSYVCFNQLQATGALQGGRAGRSWPRGRRPALPSRVGSTLSGVHLRVRSWDR